MRIKGEKTRAEKITYYSLRNLALIHNTRSLGCEIETNPIFENNKNFNYIALIVRKVKNLGFCTKETGIEAIREPLK